MNSKVSLVHKLTIDTPDGGCPEPLEDEQMR
jgi:hypothetical protein